jgi:ABC-type antimicrobial peptide transport system permease subunit
LDEYEAPYKADMGLKVLLAVMFTFFSILSVSSSETVSILFRRPEYGIMYANGMSTADIIKMVVAENILVVVAAFIVAYGWESYVLLKDTSPFRAIRVSIHKELVSVYLLAVAAIIVAISCIVPVSIIKRLKPVELIKGRE